MTAPTMESTLAAQQAAAYAAQQEMLRRQLAAVLATVWATSTAIPNFDPAAAVRFVGQVLPISLAAQRTMAALTVASYNSQVQPSRPIVVSPAAVSGANLRGNDPADYYQRPFREIKYRLSQGKTLGEALDAGRRRALSITQTDLQLAHTHTASSYLAQLDGVAEADSYPRRSFVDERNQRVADRRAERDRRRQAPPERGTPIETRKGLLRGYRRVLSSNPNHCALCVLASTRRYRRENLMPIHPGCGCTVLPIFSEDPVEPILDGSTAQQVHNIIRRDLGNDYVDAAGGPTGVRYDNGGVERLYRDIVITNDHGELGPVLGVRGQHFQSDPGKPGHLGHTRVNPVAEPTPTTPLDDVG